MLRIVYFVPGDAGLLLEGFLERRSKKNVELAISVGTVQGCFSGFAELGYSVGVAKSLHR